MNAPQLHALLSRLAGHMTSGPPNQENNLKKLYQSLSSMLLPEDLQQLKGSSFVFEASDLFSAENIPAEYSAALLTVAETLANQAAAPELRVFLREVPLRSAQLHASVPQWAHGAALDHSVGPFTNKDGRQLWYDFYRIIRQVTLYIEGSPDPALLFNVRSRLSIADIQQEMAANWQPVYHLVPGSIWINSRLLAGNSPSGAFTGLTIKGGTITLSASPHLVNGNLTITTTTRVTIRLQLQEPSVVGDPTSPYGIDARNDQLNLPQEFDFSISGQGSSIDQVSSADWRVYGQATAFEWDSHAQPTYNQLLQRVLIPFKASQSNFEVSDCQSPFNQIQGRTRITGSAWGLPSATINVLHPTVAAGIGGMLALCSSGLTAAWQGMTGGEINLTQPLLLAEPGLITISDVGAGNVFCQQKFNLWKDTRNPFGSTLQIQFPTTTSFFFASEAAGIEALMALANADFQIDRPVTVTGQPVPIHSKNSLLILSVSKNSKLIYLFDANILADNTNMNAQPPVIPQPIALALENALFKVTPVNACFLFGHLADDFVKVQRGWLYMAFGLFAYLPTLPDPYAADIGGFKYRFHGDRGNQNNSTYSRGSSLWMWLIGEVRWLPGAEADDKVKVSFFFAPLQSQNQALTAPLSDAALSNLMHEGQAGVSEPNLGETLLNPIINKVPTDQAPGGLANHSIAFQASFNAGDSIQGLPDYQADWDKPTQNLQAELFALLDVSTNADLLGISFNVFGSNRLAMVRTYGVEGGPAAFPLQVQGMDVVSQGRNVRAFTVPEISWEPVFNTAPSTKLPGDPPGSSEFVAIAPNYYPDDGGPTRIYNNSVKLVPLAPIPLSKFILEEFKNQKLNLTSSLFTLPFGMRALATLTKFVNPLHSPTLEFNQPSFKDNLKGGLQMQFNAGKLPSDDYPMFNGATSQMNNVLNLMGQPTGSSTLGQTVTLIFNDEFGLKSDPITDRGVPLTRIDLSGYGASMFSNWFNPLAQLAQTSQAKFDVWVGRTAHEVIQVRSLIEPYKIRVVRTIILYRTMSGYVYRVDTGWKPESDGRFDSSYYMKDPNDANKTLGLFANYEIHPGVVKGLFNVQNIIEADNQFKTVTHIHPNEYYLSDNNITMLNDTGANITKPVLMQMVFFDADVEIEGVVQGHVNGRVPSRRIMGFVQIAPRGIPLSKEAYQALLSYQPIPLGGDIDCVINIGQTDPKTAQAGQQMRLNRFDVNNSLAANGSDVVFAVAARGSVILPKDGSWSTVQHLRGTGVVSPLPAQLPVPLVRSGALSYQVTNQHVKQVQPDITQSLLRIANPMELLRSPTTSSVNYGFLHSTSTQKALFLTPAYKLMAGAPPGSVPTLLSKTPPLFVDAFRIVNSKGVFPNIGDAETHFGDAISLFSKGSEFKPDAIQDGGKQVLQVMQINNVAGGVVQEGYKLLKQVDDKGFSLPGSSWTLVEVGGAFKIYIEYKAANIKIPGGAKTLAGTLNFDVDSFASNAADRWKSMMNDVALVVDLGPIKRLMTIKGNWNAQNGAESQYGGSTSDADFPTPQIEFAEELKPVIEILQILQDLQSANYKAAFQSGLKLAMSNQDNSWEYKLEASKEIPVVRFPTPDFLYNDPNAALKLEAGLKLGVYFNGALKITTDAKQLLPSAGGTLGFYGRLSVMCVSLSIATVYAVGQVNLDIGADTKLGPTLHMKFGFGAQLVVGLPVVGNVSVLYMVGVEIFIAEKKVAVSAFVLFQGHAEILGGIVGVTITIEAKGTISRDDERTDLSAQVTFGLDISIFLVIDISFSTSWEEQRRIA